jgi:O-antigen ligase
MNSLKPVHGLGVVLGLGLVLYLAYSHLQYFGDLSFLGGILLLEVIVVCAWKYDQRFFLFLMIAFLWAGMQIPLKGTWTAARWVVLAAGAATGYAIWLKNPRRAFGTIHLLAFFCVCAAFVSATVSPFVQMASLKASSLLLLFLYCSSGARLAVLDRESRFFEGLIWGTEIAVYVTAFCYFVLGQSIWGNPNSLGAAMSIGVFPVLLWGWLTTEGIGARARRLGALLLCTYMVFFSVARAAMVSIILVMLVFCFCLHQYKLLVKAVAILVFLIAVSGIYDPAALGNRLGGLEDAVIYKGHKGEGLLGSRKSPWEKSIATIKERPWFGTGYGTSPSGEDPGLSFGTIASSAETEREHGSSYITIAEWVGILGAAPFAAILILTFWNVWRVCVWMNRTADPRHYSIPLAMIVLAGFVHAAFEDWLFAVGSYPAVYFWFSAFVLADLLPATVASPAPRAISRFAGSLPAEFRTAASNPALSNR